MLLSHGQCTELENVPPSLESYAGVMLGTEDCAGVLLGGKKVMRELPSAEDGVFFSNLGNDN